MREIHFRSILASPMSRFVALKQQSGTDYYSQARLLSCLDKHLCHTGYDQDSLTPAMMSSYLGTLNRLAPKSFGNRYSVIRQFSVYLQQWHEPSYILPKRPFVGRDTSRPPYIYTVDEVARLLNSFRSSSPRQAVPDLYRTLFSLLYTTGIRIGEALTLNHGDYLPAERLVHIRCGKFRKERYLVVSASMSQQLQSYLQAVPDTSDETAMFLNARGRRLNSDNVHGAFCNALATAGIIKHGSTGPRIHDFRHTFAVQRLLQWYEQGVDVNAKLPYLSTYMGHVDITSTQVYLHPFDQLMAQGTKRFRRFFLSHIHTS